MDGIGNERGSGFIHFRNPDATGGGSGFLPQQFGGILAGLAVAADCRDSECNSEIAIREQFSLPVSSAAHASQDLVDPNEIDDDRGALNLELPDIDIGNGLASDHVPVPVLRIALQGCYEYRGATKEEAAELADSVPDGTFRRYQRDWARGWRLGRAQGLWS